MFRVTHHGLVLLACLVGACGGSGSGGSTPAPGPATAQRVRQPSAGDDSWVYRPRHGTFDRPRWAVFVLQQLQRLVRERNLHWAERIDLTPVPGEIAGVNTPRSRHCVDGSPQRVYLSQPEGITRPPLPCIAASSPAGNHRDRLVPVSTATGIVNFDAEVAADNTLYFVESQFGRTGL
jgi:hypothetical protein